jgi:BirA family biotin operon repressor/biotin-[acetyl-CoA-carboxylase] ligase
MPGRCMDSTPSSNLPPVHTEQRAALLRLLREQVLPLSEAAGLLGISIPAARSEIRALEAEGFEFQTHPFLGCQFLRGPQTLHPAHVASYLTNPRGWIVQVHAKTNSTNDLGLLHGERGLPIPCAIFAEEQTAGRGRLGRRWLSEPGTGLCLSAVMSPGFAHAHWHHLAAIAAVAVTRALESACSLRVGIKWPNDLFHGHKKLGGILVESVLKQAPRSYAVIGIGLNVNSTLFAPEIATRTTSVQNALGHPVERALLAASLLENLAQCLDEAEREMKPILDAFRARSVLLGKNVSALRPDGERLTGLAECIDEEGHLVIRTAEGPAQSLAAGEITLQDWMP